MSDVIVQPPPAQPAATAAPIPAPPPEASTRDALLAELEKIPDSSATPVDPPAEEPAAEPAVEEAPAEDKPADDTDDDADDEDTDPDPDPAEEASPAKEEPPKDAALAKRLEAIQRAEKRSRESLARERLEVERQRQEMEAKLGPLREAAERFERAAARAKYDPAGVLEALGVDDLDYAARQAYQRSQAAQKDPRLREAADRAMREREHSDVLEQTRRELAELKQTIASREHQEYAAKKAASFLDSVAKHASDETPLVKTMLGKNPERARERLAAVAVEMAELTGETPDPVDVAKALEQAEREMLEERGIDYTAFVKAARKPTLPAKPAGKTLPAAMNAPRPTTPAPANKEEERDALLQELERLG